MAQVQMLEADDAGRAVGQAADDARHMQEQAQARAEQYKVAAGQAVAGVGVDIVEIDRMRRILERTPRFRERVFTEAECAYCDAKAQPAIHYALRFAAREAVLKSLGCGFRGMGLKDVEVVNDPRTGAPKAVLRGSAAAEASRQGVIEVAISLSYTHNLGVVSAVAITEEVRPRQDRKPDPYEELSRQFKDLRSMIDDLDGKLRELEAETAQGDGRGDLA